MNKAFTIAGAVALAASAYPADKAPKVNASKPSIIYNNTVDWGIGNVGDDTVLSKRIAAKAIQYLDRDSIQSLSFKSFRFRFRKIIYANAKRSHSLLHGQMVFWPVYFVSKYPCFRIMTASIFVWPLFCGFFDVVISLSLWKCRGYGRFSARVRLC